MPKKKKVTLEDVAQKANVSTASVSRVLNNLPSVSTEIRTAVEVAASELNYKHKKRSNNGQIKNVGLIIPDITNPYFPLLIKGITHVAQLQNVTTILANSDFDIENEEKNLHRLVEVGVEGIIYIPFSEHLTDFMENLLKQNFPIVFLDREIYLNNICSVTSNNEEGAFQATNYLLNLGHRDIVCISGLPYLSTSVTRLAGYHHAMSEYGIEPKPELILNGDTSIESGYKETLKLIETKNHFTAIFATNDMMAFGAWKALEEKGISVPEEISVIGYDDIPFASINSLTTIAQPAYEIGRNALLLLMDLITKRRLAPQKILLRDSLIIRKSCKKI